MILRGKGSLILKIKHKSYPKHDIYIEHFHHTLTKLCNDACVPLSFPVHQNVFINILGNSISITMDKSVQSLSYRSNRYAYVTLDRNHMEFIGPLGTFNRQAGPSDIRLTQINIYNSYIVFTC